MAAGASAVEMICLLMALIMLESGLRRQVNVR